jgi:hypothetical protein
MSIAVSDANDELPNAALASYGLSDAASTFGVLYVQRGSKRTRT